ncbi:MAG TPA: hypothetical protein VF380_01555 [Solirubrobacteraceae bacterium]
MGHTDPALALRVYAQAMRRGEDEQAQLRAVVEGTSRHRMDTNEGKTGVEGSGEGVAQTRKVVRLQAV